MTNAHELGAINRAAAIVAVWVPSRLVQVGDGVGAIFGYLLRTRAGADEVGCADWGHCWASLVVPRIVGHDELPIST